MSYVKIPIDNTPFSTQTFKVTLAGNKNIHIKLSLAYHDLYNLWLADIGNADTDELLISNLPLVCGENLLKQFGYLGIGEAYVIKTEPTLLEHPDNNTLGSTFVLIWGDES